MKQKKNLSTVLFTLLWLPQLLFAQKGDAFLSMKPGDWFEVLVSDTARKPNDASYRYNIRYLFKNVKANGNRDYLVTFERIRIVFSPGKNVPLGYDSYYPSFKQGISQKTVKPSFQANVSKEGKVLSLTPIGQFPDMELHEIAVHKSYGGSSAQFRPVGKVITLVLSEYIFGAIRQKDQHWFSGQLYKDSDLTFLIIAASFPLQSNVVIEGKIANINQQVRNNLGLYLPEADPEFKILKDGSFRWTAHIVQGNAVSLKYRSPRKPVDDSQAFPAGLDVKIGTEDWNIPIYVRPGDTLRISADGNDLINSLKFTGKAANAAIVGMKLAKLMRNKKTPEIPYSPTSFSADTYAKSQETDLLNFKKLIAASMGQLNTEGLKFLTQMYTFEQATARLDFLSKTAYLSSPDVPESFEGFPAKFFSSIDTLPVLMVENPQANWYQSFLNPFKLYASWKSNKFHGSTSASF